MLAALVSAIASAGVAAQSYPAHSIRMIVPYVAGGSVDVLGRAVAEKISVALGQPVVADNRPGANGSIAHGAVASASPDGYTIGMSGTSPLVLAPHQIKDLPYDPTKDFAYLACAGTTRVGLRQFAIELFAAVRVADAEIPIALEIHFVAVAARSEHVRGGPMLRRARHGITSGSP